MLVCGLFRTTDFGEDKHVMFLQSQWTGRLGLASVKGGGGGWLGARKVAVAVAVAGREEVKTISLPERFQL